MGVLFNLIGLVCGIGFLVCFIMVVVQMFQHGQTGLGIASILLVFCGIGGLVAFVVGWINAKPWNIEKLMLVWTALLVVGVIANVLGVVTAASTIRAI